LELNINRARRKAVAARLNIVWEEQPADEDNSSRSTSPPPQESPQINQENSNNNGNSPTPSSPNPTTSMISSSSVVSLKSMSSGSGDRSKRDLPDDLFEDVVKDVKSLMHDTFARFTRSTMYHQFVKETEMRHNILANANII